jgi:hypothetical protein
MKSIKPFIRLLCSCCVGFVAATAYLCHGTGISVMKLAYLLVTTLGAELPTDRDSSLYTSKDSCSTPSRDQLWDSTVLLSSVCREFFPWGKAAGT